MMYIKITVSEFKQMFILLILLSLASCDSTSNQPINEVKIVGQMKDVMFKGELYGKINLDTIANKDHLYGIGPLDYLRGEVLILDGKAYKSTVETDSTMKVVETFAIQAPFFGYATIPNWIEHDLADSIQTITQLEQYLDSSTKNSKRPFFFKLSGTIEQATIHIVDLPEGSKVSSPEEAHEGQTNYKLKNEPSEIIGFFSIAHKTIFMHHDTFLHMHLITADRQKMGHLDEILFKKGTVKLYLPTD